MRDIRDKVGAIMNNNIAKDISKIVLESLKSGEDVGQKYVSKMKRRKLKPSKKEIKSIYFILVRCW